ncbi:hypothetical protein SMICM304S_02065 [Streptomyces microflavus]
MAGGGAAVDGDRAVQRAAGEVRHEPVDRAQQSRLADPRMAHHEAEFALVDHQVHVPQDRLVGPVVHDGDLVEGDHAASSVRGAETYGTGLPGGGARNPAAPASRTAAAGTSGSVGQLRG